jgi:hypothetical protein
MDLPAGKAGMKGMNKMDDTDSPTKDSIPNSINI